ncbi:ABC transporter ATP-binding protein [Lacticaseibacillus daqingensis]|uniref:ABC transporter ATP-binding protein n=1 Tax=Lacticaseibacillus daqingensis TaxID=2486014 RepID=UPI001CDBF6C2|nr:ABC transporter ATP-binding protein [Lacticaseibacillus daqingensis]
MQLLTPGVFGLVAPNGSGKSTLLNLIAGLLRPQSGTITIDGQPNTTRQVFKQVAYLQDNRVLYPYLTGRAHLDFVAATHHLDQAHVAAVAEQLKASAFLDRRVRKYSLGMKQRLLMVMALVTDAPLILLDEPLNGLDPTCLRLVHEAILAQASQGKTVLVSSHNLPELSRVTQDIWFLHDQQLQHEVVSSEQAAATRYAELYEAVE